jgi:hypothetical protein
MPPRAQTEGGGPTASSAALTLIHKSHGLVLPILDLPLEIRHGSIGARRALAKPGTAGAARLSLAGAIRLRVVHITTWWRSADGLAGELQHRSQRKVLFPIYWRDWGKELDRCGSPARLAGEGGGGRARRSPDPLPRSWLLRHEPTEPEELMDDDVAKRMRASFEAGLSCRVARHARIKTHLMIPAHWFAPAVSECQEMFIAGQYYGTISTVQVAVEVLSVFLCDLYQIPGKRSSSSQLWQNLLKRKQVSSGTLAASENVLRDRNAYHHLKQTIEQEFTALEARAEECINNLHVIESDVFAFSFDTGVVKPERPERWGHSRDGLMQVSLRHQH